MTTELTGLPGRADPVTDVHAPPMWSAPVHALHAGTALDCPRPRLLDRAWSYEPAFCLTGFRVIALWVADGMFVCPLCGLRTS